MFGISAGRASKYLFHVAPVLFNTLEDAPIPHVVWPEMKDRLVMCGLVYEVAQVAFVNGTKQYCF